MKRKKQDKKKSLLVLGGLAVLLPLIGTAFAASITINSNQDIEFGQGTEDVAACTSSAQVALASALSSGTLYLSELSVSSINSNCDGKYIRATLLNSIGTKIDGIVWQISDAGNSPTTFKVVSNNSSTSTSNSLSGGVMTNYPSSESSSLGMENSIVAANIDDVLLETSASAFTE
jgi:hypothetical protein